jgi:hypothetical protein
MSGYGFLKYYRSKDQLFLGQKEWVVSRGKVLYTKLFN